MRRKEEILRDYDKTPSMFGNKRLIVELLADLRDEQISLNKKLLALLELCRVEGVDQVMAGEHPKEPKYNTDTR